MAESRTKLCSEWPIDWKQGTFKVLGVVFSTDLKKVIEMNYQGLDHKIKRTLSMWTRRNLTILGKVTIVKILPLPNSRIFSSISQDLLMSL